MATTMTVRLQGYPEAVLARPSVALPVSEPVTPNDLITGIGALDNRLREALMHGDGTPRQSTRLLVNGSAQEGASPVPAAAQVTLLAALPCDG